MPASKTVTIDVDLSSVGPARFADGRIAFVTTDGFRSGSVSASSTGAWATGVLTVYKSNDGVATHALGAGTTLGPGADFESLSNIDYAGLRFAVTTAESGASARIVVHLNDSTED
jgi:hypothetical protein